MVLLYLSQQTKINVLKVQLSFIKQDSSHHKMLTVTVNDSKALLLRSYNYLSNTGVEIMNKQIILSLMCLELLTWFYY